MVYTASAMLSESAHRYLDGPGHLDLAVTGFGDPEEREDEFVKSLYEITGDE